MDRRQFLATAGTVAAAATASQALAQTGNAGGTSAPATVTVTDIVQILLPPPGNPITSMQILTPASPTILTPASDQVLTGGCLTGVAMPDTATATVDNRNIWTAVNVEVWAALPRRCNLIHAGPVDFTGLYNGPNNIQVHVYNHQPPGGPTATSHYVANFNRRPELRLPDTKACRCANI